MRHRISAGVIVEDQGKVLLVHHQIPGKYDFWVAPGGGVENSDDLETTAIREVREECGLEVSLGRIAYIEDLVNSEMRICKIWFTGTVAGGDLFTESAEAAAESIVGAKFLSRDEFEGKVVFPPVLTSDYWRDKESGFVESRYLGLRRMEGFQVSTMMPPNNLLQAARQDSQMGSDTRRYRRMPELKRYA